MLFTKGIKSVNYTVVTFNNVVHIFGLAGSNQELNKVQEIAASNKGVEEVISYIKIIEE
jgi:osmotically-inducible protein OsmY